MSSAEPSPPFALCGRSLPQATFAERVQLAGSVGWPYVSILGSDLPELAAAGLGLRQISAQLRHHNVGISEVEAVVDWLPGGLAPPWLAGLPETRSYLEVADALGARAVIATDLNAGPTPALDQSAEAFAGLCDRAAVHDLRVCLEFVPWGRIPDLPTAWDVVLAANRANGGVMLDTWHLFRSGGTVEDVAHVPADRISGLQINDAPEWERGARTAQGTQNRLLPGHGVIGVAELLTGLLADGCTAPIGLEVTSEKLASLPAEAALALLAHAAYEVMPPF